jgi:starvation-inducible DNA-binding protein
MKMSDREKVVEALSSLLADSFAVDEIAERIRALGARAPGSFSEFARIAAIKEATGTPSAAQMVDDLVADQRLAIDAAKRVVDAAERAGDQASADLGVRRIEVHEKNAWMLRSHLE